jgi:hypothetical protein
MWIVDGYGVGISCAAAIDVSAVNGSVAFGKRGSNTGGEPPVHFIDGLGKAVVGGGAGRELVIGTNGIQPAIKTESQQAYADYEEENGGDHGHQGYEPGTFLSECSWHNTPRSYSGEQLY